MQAIGKLVVITKEEDTKTNSTIIYTDNSRATVGRVVSFGEDVKSISVGDQLILNWANTMPVKIEDVTYHVVHLDNVFAKI
jgi:co-chaperonin GroES (HSP10)